MQPLSHRPLFVSLLALAALIGGCQAAPDAGPNAPSEPSPGSASAGLIGTAPTGALDLTDGEVAEVAAAFLAAMPGLTERPLHARASGTTGRLPAEVAGVAFAPWESRGQQPSLDLRFLSRDGDQLIVQAHVYTGLGGPDVHDIRFSRTEGPFEAPFEAAGGSWAVAEFLGSVGYL